MRVVPMSWGYRRSLFSSHPLPHPAQALLLGGGRNRDELPVTHRGVSAMEKSFFSPLPFNETVFPSSFLAFHSPCPRNRVFPFLLSDIKSAASTPLLAKEEQKSGKIVSSRYYVQAGFPAAITGCCSARDSQSPTPKSEETSHLTPLGSLTGRAEACPGCRIRARWGTS